MTPATRTTRLAAALAIIALSAACTGATAPPPPTPVPSPTVAPPTVAPPSAATAPPAAAARLTVFKSLGRKQCEEGGETPETLAVQLKAAGVEATPAGCADDGMMRAAMCGMGTGHLGLLDIRAADAAAAARAGFRPFSDLPDAARIPCPGSPGAAPKK
jgi:hypothetical protein